MTRPYRLHYAPDNASLIVRLALEDIGAPYETVLVDRVRQGQKSAAYLELNPNGLIPVLETPQGAIFETGAILIWLADRHARLAPAPNAPQRGSFLKWLFFLSNTLHSDLRMDFHPESYVGTDPAAQTALRKTVRLRIQGHLTILEQSYAQQAGPMTVADYYLACLIRWRALYPLADPATGFSSADTPRLHHRLQQLETTPSVDAARTAEGLGPTPFTAPRLARPPEGTAT